MVTSAQDVEQGLTHLVWILRGAGSARDAPSEARALLLELGSLGALLAASPQRQLHVAGGDEAVVADLRRCSELIAYVLMSRLPDGPLVADCERMHDYLRATLAYNPVEEFRVLYLDVAKRLIREDLLSVGTVDCVTVHPREIIRRAIDLGATALILVHNHPGGSLRPSSSDASLTKRVANVARELDIEVIDHLIVSTGGVASLRRLGLLA
jgi:DNA repair protein RadC